MLQFKKFLVTGGAGFIGSHLVDRLLAEGGKVAVVDNLSTGKRENLNCEATFYEFDIKSLQLDSIFKKEKPEVVYHLAFNTNVPLSVRDPLFDERSISCSLNVFLNAVRHGVRKVVMASSAFVYGNTEKLPVTEANEVLPVSPYAISKIAAENYLLFFYKTYHLPIVILRFATVYGPRQRVGAMADYINKISVGQSAEMYGDGNITRDYVYVKDIVDANIMALNLPDEHPDPIFNLGSNKEIMLNTVYNKIAEMLNIKATPIFLPALKGDIKRFMVSYSKAEKEFGWKPTVAIEDGLKETLKYYGLI